jgi:hypothetical protein
MFIIIITMYLRKYVNRFQLNYCDSLINYHETMELKFFYTLSFNFTHGKTKIHVEALIS